MTDFTSIGAAHRAEAEKAKHRTIASAVALVLAHLLDLRPSEAEALGLKVTVNDPAIVYGAIALLFGYQLSRLISETNKGEALLPLRVEWRRMRANLRLARRMYRMDKKKRRRPQTPNGLKKTARRFVIFDNLALLPYRLIAVLFVLTALVFMCVDVWRLGWLVWLKSPVVSDVANLIAPA